MKFPFTVAQLVMKFLQISEKFIWFHLQTFFATVNPLLPETKIWFDSLLNDYLLAMDTFRKY